MSSKTQVNPFFTPTQFSGCAVWLDGADPNGNGIQPANGTLISTWRDKSGNNTNATQATAINQPVYQTELLNGLPTLQFPAISRNNLVALDTPAFNYGTTNRTSFFVLRNNYSSGTPAASPHWFWPKSGNGTAAQSLVGWIQSVERNGFGTCAISAPIGSFFILTNVFGASSLFERMYTNGNPSNGNSLTRSGAFISATSGYRIGALDNADSGSSVYWFDGNIAEVILFNQTLTTFQIQQMEGYLAWKWGLQSSLPSTHPYKNSPIAPLSNPPVTLPLSIQNAFFTPTQISGCQLWLDAADTNSMSLTGSVVNTWNDKSGSGITYISSNSPTLINNALNGKSVMNFVGSSSQYFYGGATSSCDLIHTHFFLYFNSVQSIGQTLFGSSNQFNIVQEGGGNCYGDVAGFTDGALYKFQTGGAYRLLSVLVSSPNTYPTTNGTVYFNGTQIALVNNSGGYNVASKPTNLLIGSGNTKYTGTFAEGIVYAGLLTTSQRQQVEGYLAWKWGLQGSLPATHPYKSSLFPPLSNPPVTLPVLKTATWQPTQITGCQLWLDGADSATTVLTGSNITQWNDKSTNQYNVTPYSTFSNATVATRYQNNNNVLNFSGYNLYRTATNAAFYPLDAFIILSLKTGTTDAHFLSLSRTDTTTDWTSIALGAYASGRWGQSSTGGARSYDTSTTESSPSPFLIMNWTLANNNFVMRRNTTTIGSTRSFTWALPTNPSFLIGYPAVTTPNILFDVFIGEIVIYNTSLSIAQRQQVEGYLAWKWGLQGSLPSNHPFKLWPPPP